MNEDLNLRGSFGLNLLRCLVAAALLLGIVFSFLSLYDPRTEEEKLADARAEFLSDPMVVTTLKGIRKVYSKYGISKLNYVNYLYGSKVKYVFVKFNDTWGEEKEGCYNVNEEKLCDPEKYRIAKSNLEAYNNFSGSKKEYARAFSEEHELQILFEEIFE